MDFSLSPLSLYEDELYRPLDSFSEVGNVDEECKYAPVSSCPIPLLVPQSSLAATPQGRKRSRSDDDEIPEDEDGQKQNAKRRAVHKDVEVIVVDDTEEDVNGLQTGHEELSYSMGVLGMTPGLLPETPQAHYGLPFEPPSPWGTSEVRGSTCWQVTPPSMSSGAMPQCHRIERCRLENEIKFRYRCNLEMLNRLEALHTVFARGIMRLEHLGGEHAFKAECLWRVYREWTEELKRIHERMMVAE